MKKVLVVHGSPRKKGNSHDVVAALCGEFGDDVEVTSVEMQKLNASGCVACGSCRDKTERCVIQDDLTSVYETLHEADVLVLASPVYFGDLAAQIKPFIDRMYHLFTPNFHEAFDEETKTHNGLRVSRLKEGVKLVFITTQGGAVEEIQADIHPRYENFFRWLGFDEVHNIRGLGDPLQVPHHRMEEAFAQARELAPKLVA